MNNDPIISIVINRKKRQLLQSIAELNMYIVHVDTLTQAEALQLKLDQLNNELQILNAPQDEPCQSPRITKSYVMQ